MVMAVPLKQILKKGGGGGKKKEAGEGGRVKRAPYTDDVALFFVDFLTKLDLKSFKAFTVSNCYAT